MQTGGLGKFWFDKGCGLRGFFMFSWGAVRVLGQFLVRTVAPLSAKCKCKISQNPLRTSILIRNALSVNVKFSSNRLLYNIIVDYTTTFFKNFVFGGKTP